MDERRRRFEALLLPHLDAAYNLARWLSRSAAEAEDVVQDAMLRALKSFDRFRGGDARPWLLAIVRNCHRTAAKRRASFVSVPIDEEIDGMTGDIPNAFRADTPDPESAATANAERRKLDTVLAALPEEFREVLILRELEEMSYREIAEATGVPMGTVMSRLARARALLKERWLQSEGASS
ncbi:MAG: sigma-70 family RNA polymerase sigma factor [Proteobacteria bacterium]|nr:sigma-70 family RNA polymerase sigma factor [Pseudomonadota bacterium]